MNTESERSCSKNVYDIKKLVLTMKISANHPTPLERPDYHIYNNSLVQKKWSLRYDHDTNYNPP